MQISEPAEYVMLGLLYTRPMHGYEMFQLIENGTLGQIIHVEMSQSMLSLRNLNACSILKQKFRLKAHDHHAKFFIPQP